MSNVLLICLELPPCLPPPFFLLIAIVKGDFLFFEELPSVPIIVCPRWLWTSLFFQIVPRLFFDPQPGQFHTTCLLLSPAGFCRTAQRPLLFLPSSQFTASAACVGSNLARDWSRMCFTSRKVPSLPALHGSTADVRLEAPFFFYYGACGVRP